MVILTYFPETRHRPPEEMVVVRHVPPEELVGLAGCLGVPEDQKGQFWS